MKIHINIAEDVELRAFVKEQIRGAVKSITREEILGYIVAEIQNKNKSMDGVFGQMLREEAKKKVAGSTWEKGMLETIIREETRTALKAHMSKL